MDPAQEAAWHSLLDLYELEPSGWALIGGQLVHLLCAERGYSPQRPTDDADAVVDARVPGVLGAVTSALQDLGFEPQPSSDGIQHRWKRGKAVLDVLIPEGTGARTEARRSASGFPTVAAPGGTQALARSEVVAVDVGDRSGHVPRPMLLSAMILKAAARTETTGTGLDRHCHDFAALASVLAASDIARIQLTRKDRQRLGRMIEVTRSTLPALQENPEAARRLLRLEHALDDPFVHRR
ncbi:hypothetical protein [Jatrophihabitans sp.]|uniref:hypothetical protein n=1 Tax=Jatrophihabitans sp. TaxID=1932789 RepID=UPI002BBE96ED|nr:hypothetical protein [Jatrophihabitans sp.]